jgi:hypothetical protein
MGIGLIFIPGLITTGINGTPVNPAITGMLRGAGGSIIPYSLLYILIALDPFRKSWALYVIIFANISAILLDIASVVTREYSILNAMIDLPVELLSLAGIILVFRNKKSDSGNTLI